VCLFSRLARFIVKSPSFIGEVICIADAKPETKDMPYFWEKIPDERVVFARNRPTTTDRLNLDYAQDGSNPMSEKARLLLISAD